MTATEATDSLLLSMYRQTSSSSVEFTGLTIASPSDQQEAYPAIQFKDQSGGGNASKYLIYNSIDERFSMVDGTDVKNMAFEDEVNAAKAKVIVRTETFTGTGGNYSFVTFPEGYTLITAMNPNWANEYYIVGVSAYTNGYGVLFWNKEIPTSVSFTINTFWIKK